MEKLDKYEYNLKLEEIDKLVDQGAYEEAADVADAVDWRRVRNVRTLCLISEIYEAAGRLEDSKHILERAYKKSPVGKNVLYRLVEVTTALHQYDEAMEYYSDYVQVAPHDDNKYVLKYKIYRGRGSSIEDQIEILEEYLGQEYTERWAYELAQLYRQAGQMQKCLAACDDLVLWFHSGKYVQKALELKKKYAALTPKQQQIYEECLQEEAREKQMSQPEPEAEDNVVVNVDNIEGDVMAEKIMAETEKEIAEQVTARKAELEEHQKNQNIAEPEISATKKVDTDDIRRASAALAAGVQAAVNGMQEEMKSDADEQDAADARVQDAQPGTDMGVAAAHENEGLSAQKAVSAAGEKEKIAESAGDVKPVSSAEDVNADSQKMAADGADTAAKNAQGAAVRHNNPEVSSAAQRVPQTPEPPIFDKEKFQRDIARDMQKIVSSVARKTEIPDEDLPASVESRIQMTQKVEAPKVQPQTAGRLSIDDILLSMGDKGKEIAKKAEQAKQEKEEQLRQEFAEKAEQLRQEQRMRDEELAKEARQEEERIQEQKRQEEARRQEQQRLEEEEERQREEEERRASMPKTTMADVVQEELTDAQREALQYTSNPEKLLRNSRALPTYEEEETPGSTIRMPEREELMEAARQELMEEEKIRLPKEQAEKKLSGAKEEQKLVRRGRFGSRYSEKAAAARNEGEELEEQELSLTSKPAQQDAPQQVLESSAIQNDREAGQTDADEYAAEAQAKQEAAAAAEMADDKADDLYGEDTGYEDLDMEYEAGEDADDAYPEEDGFEGQDIDCAAESDSVSEEEAYANDGNYEDAGADETENAAAYEEDYAENEYDDAPYEDGDYLTIPEHLRSLFAGFTQIPELEDQIANAIIQAEAKGSDRTSKTGNILIFGAHGSGKTTLAMNLAKAIAQDRGSQVVKMAKIYAADLNKKDIASTVARIAGGTLIIEEAGDLDDNTIEQLTTAMEFRTDGLIVILEDEQKYVHELLMSHPRFTMKYTAQIYIPQYTAQELIYFAQIYANAQDYVIGEEGQDALAEKISTAVENGTEVTIKDVIEMVGKAIQRSNRFFRKMKMGKRRYDENDFIILFGKDFGSGKKN